MRSMVEGASPGRRGPPSVGFAASSPKGGASDVTAAGSIL